MELGVADDGFALEVTRFGPTLNTATALGTSLAEIDSIVCRCADEREVVFGLICDEGAGGAFYLFISGDRAWVHLNAGPCRTALSRAASETAEVMFRLDNGEKRTVPMGRTVSRQEGIQALRHWFATEQEWPKLEWIDV